MKSAPNGSVANRDSIEALHVLGNFIVRNARTSPFNDCTLIWINVCNRSWHFK